MFDKNIAIEKLYERYNDLTNTEKNKFSRIANKILNNNYILKDKQGDNDDYYFILEQLELFKAYFLIMDYEINYYEVDKMISINTLENRNRYQLKKIDTVILLVIRILYQNKLQESTQLNDIYASIGEIHEQIEKTDVLKGRISKTDLKSTLRLLKNYSVIDYKATDVYDDETLVRIYPPIVHIVNINDLEKLNEKLKELEKGGDNDEETN